MIRQSTQQEKFDDIKAICTIARTLLGLDNGGGIRGTIGLLAEDFTSGSSDKQVDDLLQVSSKHSNHLVMFLTNDKLLSTHSFGSARPHSAYAPSISFVPSRKHSPLCMKSSCCLPGYSESRTRGLMGFFSTRVLKQEACPTTSCLVIEFATLYQQRFIEITRRRSSRVSIFLFLPSPIF